MHRSWTAYAGALALVVLAAALSAWPLQALSTETAWLTLYPAVMIAALYGGLYAGLLATALSVVAVTCFWPPLVAGFQPAAYSHWLDASIFVLSGCLVSAVADAMHRAQARAMNAQAELANQSYLIFEGSPTGMIAIDADNGRVVQTNLIAQQMFGYSAEEFLTKTAAELTHPDDREESRLRNEQLAKGLINHLHFEKRYLRKDGSSFWAESRVATLKNAEGKVTRFVGSSIDLTEKMLAEASRREIETRYQHLFENMLEGYAHCLMLYREGIPDDFIYLDVNSKFEHLTGLKDVVGKRVSEVIPGIKASSGDLLETYGRVAKSGKPERLEYYLEKLGIWFSVSVYSPSPDHFVAVFDNITERKKAEDELRIAAITFESNEGITVTDANAAIIRVNPTFTRITGYAPDEVIGRPLGMLGSTLQNEAFYAAIWKSVDQTGAWEGHLMDRRKNGDIYPLHLTLSAVRSKNGLVTNYVATFSDSSESQAAAEEIKHLAFYDFLTGLPNRRLLVDRLKQAMAVSVRNGKEGALLFIDLDDFKTLNDTQGHDIGDQLLQQVAKRLEACVREGDTVARFGGDEFVVMLEGLSERSFEAAAQIELIGEKILSQLSQPYQLGEYSLHSTPSIGVTLFIDHKGTIDELFKQADIAMYQAKRAGRNTMRFFDPQMQQTLNSRAALEVELRNALQNRQFHLYYQIQVDSSHRPLGAEALIRWVHPERGLVSPLQFIPLAEESGLILAIGKWVLEAACSQLREWQKDALTRELVLAVNVSAKQFQQADFVSQVQDILRRNAVNPKLLKLELTESMFLENIESMIATMNALKEVGVQFSLDDFGTGYSSLQYLKRLPLDQLKIDQSFVRDLLHDQSDRAIVRTIIAMARSLKLKVIAEGVEIAEQKQFLLDNGCANFQGYLFGKPVPIDQFAALLKHPSAA